MKLAGTTVHHWSKAQANIALSSGQADLSGAVKSIAKGISLFELFRGRPEDRAPHRRECGRSGIPTPSTSKATSSSRSGSQEPRGGGGCRDVPVDLFSVESNVTDLLTLVSGT